MNKLTDFLIFLIFLTSIIISSAILGYLCGPIIDSELNKIQGEYVNTPEECINLSLNETAYCLNDYVKSIYQYNLTQDLIKLDKEELLEKGGDCKNWAEFYYDQIIQLGFYSNKIKISTGNKTAHMFTTISDNTGYCILDQRLIKCFKIKTEDDD